MKKKHFFTFIIIIMMTLLYIPLGIFHESEAASDSTDFSTTIYTFKEIVIFTYYDDTDIRIEDKDGNAVWSGTLSKDGHHVYTGTAGIYRIFGSKSYTALSGDAVSSYCSGYFGVDQSGRGTSTLINTYMTGSGSFTVFAYEDGTNFTIKDLDTKKLIYAGSLNKGEHLKMPQAPLRKFIQVSANKPVSALCYDDQDYYVPSFNGTFTGELFYGFSGYRSSWTNSITVTAYENDTNVKVVNTETGDTISSYTLGAGQVHADPVTSDVYWKLEASKPVTAANIPYVGYDAYYAYMTRAIDEKGVGAGKHFYVPTIGSRIDVFSFEDDNEVTITCLGRKDEYPYTNKQEVFKGTLNAGQVHTFTSNTGQYVYEIEGTKNVSVLQSNGGAGAEFMPLSYTLGLSDLCVSATDIKFSPEKEAYNEGDTITVEIDVHNYGAEDASNIVVEAYDGDPDGEGTVPVIASKNIDYISSGSFVTVSFEYTIPKNPEFRNIVVKVDPSDTIRESNSSNNKAIRFINRNHDLEPPLAVSVSAPTGLQINEEGVLEGNPFTITANIFNIGDAAATDVTVKLETLDGLTIAEGNETINIGTLYQNQQREFNWKISADPKILGVNRFRIIADASNADAKSVNRSINITIETTNIDKEKPSKPVITRNPDRDFYNDDYIINILSGEDDESGVAETVYQTSGAVNSSWKHYSGPIKISKEGTTEIEAKTIDRAGNESEIEKEVISINRNIHVFPSIKIEPDKEYSNENYKIELITEYDDGYVQESVYSSVYYQITGMADFEVYDEPFTIDRLGKTNIKVKIIDRLGNENIVTKTVNLDKTKPNNPNDVLKESINKRGEEDIEITPTGDAADTIWLAPEGTTIFKPSSHMTKASGDATTINVPSEEGKYRLYVIDCLGNISSPSNAIITVDNTPPTINGIEDGAIYKEYKTVTFNEGTAKLNGEDFGSGTTIDKNGKYTLVVIDEIGNTRTISFTIDDDEEWVNKDIEALQIGFAKGDSDNWVTNHMTLPTAGKNGSVITWQSSDESIIAPNGKVTLPNNQQGDQVVTLTATITKGNVTQTKPFDVKVISDIIPPTITLVGNSPITLAQGELYVEKGVQAIDNKDGNITGRVIVEGFVDTNKIGTYILTYKVTDVTGNVATVQRIINVVRSTVSENTMIEAKNDEKIPDQKISDAIDSANQNNEHQVKIIVPEGVTADKPVKVNISKEQVQKAKDHGISLALETKDTAIEVPIDAVDTSSMSSNSRLELVCEQVDTTKSENKQMLEAVKNINTSMEIYENKVYDFKMKVVEEDESGNIINEEPIENFTSKNEDIKLRIVVGKDMNEETKLMTFYYNEKTGEWEYIRGEYDLGTGEMKLLTNHLSIYSVMHLTKEQKEQEMAKILNKPNITIPEVLNVIEDPDMEFDPVAVREYDTFTNAHREDVAKEMINKRPFEGYDYPKLKEKYSEIVTDKYNNINSDNTNPVITLVGQDEIWLYVNEKYIEQGATATDNIDGDLTGRIVVIGNVDTSIPGEYTRIYTVRDLNGNTAQATRKVIVRRKHKSSNNEGNSNQTAPKIDTEINPKIEVNESTKTFNDLDGHWAKGIVETLAAKGIIAGDTQGNFNPNMGITRAEFATLITKTLNIEIEDKETGFEDISEDDWYAPYIAAARRAGIVSGISETQYAPDRIVTRQEMTAMVMRAYRLLKEVKVNDEDISKLDKFADSEKISTWAHKDVYTAKYLKLVKGREEQNFAPKDKTLRAEAAALIFNLLKALGRI